MSRKMVVATETKQPAVPPATVADIIKPQAATITERLQNYLSGIKTELENIDNEIARLKSQIDGKEDEKRMVLEVLARYSPAPLKLETPEPTVKAVKVAGTRPRIADEDILKAVGEESKSLTQLATIVGTTPATIRKKVTALVSAGKLEEFKSGVSVMVKRKK